MRRLVVLCACLVSAGVALAQNNSIQWLTDVPAAVRQAQSTRRPLMVYLSGSVRDEDSRVDRDQKRSFRNATVLRRAQSFVPLKLMRAQREAVEQFGFTTASTMEIRFVTPEGELLDTLSAGGVAQADSLAQKMSLVLQTYGRKIYDKEVKPKLEDEKAKPQELKLALQAIADFRIKDADKTVTELLDRERLDPAVRQAAYDALVALSTKTAVEKLLELAHGGDKAADKVLEKLTPVGAELLLAGLKADATPFDYTAYKAIVKICRIEKPKQERYFENSVQKLKDEEVQRVTEIVKAAAAQWKAENE